MKNKSYKQYIGVSKTLYNSGATIINYVNNHLQQTTVLTERVIRSKSAGNWPTEPLLKITRENSVNFKYLKSAENRDVITPEEYENILDEILPFDKVCHINRLNKIS